MKKFLSSALMDALKTDTIELLEEAERLYAPLSAEELLRVPPDGGWSIAQVMDHLNGYGNYYLPLLENSIETGIARNIKTRVHYQSGWLGNYFTAMMLPSAVGTQKKMKTPPKHHPKRDLPAIEVREEFFRQQKRMLYLLDRAAGTRLDQYRIPISILPLIRLKTGDVFRFMIAHNQRHALQMARVFNHLHTDPTSRRASVLPPTAPAG